MPPDELHLGSGTSPRIRRRRGRRNSFARHLARNPIYRSSKIKLEAGALALREGDESATTMNLLLGTLLAVVIAGAFIVATTTSIALWKYLLGVLGLLIFVLPGLTNRTESQ